MLRVLFYLAPFVLALYCLVEVIRSRDDEIRYLSKVVWLLLVLFFPLIGSLAWLVAGRPETPRARAHERSVPNFPEYDRPGRAAAISPDDDAVFLAQVRERAEKQRREYAEKRRREVEQEEAERQRRKSERNGGAPDADADPTAT